MGILRSSCRRCILLLLVLTAVACNAACCVAQNSSLAAISAPPTTQVQTASAAGKNESPFQRVIGDHLDAWRLASQTAKARIPQSSSALPNQATYSRVNPPAILSSPAITLPLTSNFAQGIAAMVSGDFNHDGKVDLATIRPGGSIQVILNPGTFTNIRAATPLTPNESAVTLAPNVVSVYTADLNGDSNLDLVAMDLSHTQAIIWLGKGDGTFGNATTLSLTPASGADWTNGTGSMLVGDVNGDGRPDIVALAATPISSNLKTILSVQTFLNLGDGTFAAGKEVDATFSDHYSISYGSPDFISATGAGITGIAFTVTDYGSATPANFGTDLIVLSSQPDGSFTAPIEPVTVLVASQSAQSIVQSTNLRAKFSSFPSDSTLGTGIPTRDLILSVGDGIIYDIPYVPGSSATQTPIPLIGAYGEFGSNGNLTIPIATNTGLALPNVIALRIGDFDGDGYEDILAIAGSAAYIFPNNGSGAFTASPTQTSGLEGTNLSVSDFDGDKRQSFAWGGAQLGIVAYYHSLPSGQFYSAPAIGGATAASDGGNSVFANVFGLNAVADVDGDGVLDLIGMNKELIYMSGVGQSEDIVLGHNNIKTAHGGAAGNFTFSTILPGAQATALLGQGAIIQPFTLKTSGGTTIVLNSTSDSTTYTMTGDATGHFGAPVALSYGTLDPRCGMDYGDAGDINGDGIQDIVLAYGGDFACSIPPIPGRGKVQSGYFIFLGNADGTFQTATYTPLGTSLYKLRLMNLSGVKGRLDIVAIDSFSPSFHVYVIPGHADGTFGDPIDVAPNYTATDVVAGDFNSDGHPDLSITTLGQYDPATGLLVGNTTGVLQIPGLGDYNFGFPTLAAQTIYPATATYTDVNGDGAPDLVVSTYWASTSYYPPHILADAVSSLLIYPNLGGGSYGPAISEPVAPYPPNLVGANRWLDAPLFVGNFGSGSSSDVVLAGNLNSSLFLNIGLPTLQLAADSDTVTQDSPLTLTATVTQGGNTVSGSSGIVTFSVGSTSLGSSSVVNGVATLTTSAMPLGSDTVTATYTGDANKDSLTATTAVTVQALAPQFTMTLASGNLSIPQGATGTAVLSLTSNATFTGAVAFTCNGAPAEATCTVSPGTLSLGSSQTVTVSVVIATTAKNNHYQAGLTRQESRWTVLSAGSCLAGCFLSMLPRRRRRRTINLLLIAIAMFGSLHLLTGCSGGDRYPGTPVGVSTLTIQATSGGLTQTATVTVAVTSSSQ